MNPLVKSTLSVLLSIMMLVTGSGVSLAKMVCVKSGYTTISVSDPDECCKHEHKHPPVTIEEKCCDISSVHISALQYLTTASQNIQKSLTCVELPALSFNFDVHSDVVSSVVREHCDTELTDSPPIRVLTGNFLI